MLNKIRKTLSQNPKTTAIAGIFLAISLKTHQQLSPTNLEEQYLSELISNQYELPEVVKRYMSIKPHNVAISRFSEDTLIIIDHSREQSFYLTCPQSGEYCILKDGNNLSVKLIGTVF